MPDGSSAFPVYDDLNVDVFQIQLHWDEAAPSRPSRPRDPEDPAYEWPSELDRAVKEAGRHGIDVAIMVKNTAQWANGARGPAWAPDSSLDFGMFVRAAARRYDDVRRWMIWGEPTRAANFQPLPPESPEGPRRYAQLLDVAYRELKLEDRRNIVVGGMTSTVGDIDAPQFLRGMKLADGRPPRLDEFGHNPFARRFPNLRKEPYHRGVRDLSDIDTFAREVQRHYEDLPRFRESGPRLWLSEFTISSDRSNRAFDFHVSRAEQARWLRTAFAIARRKPYIAGLGWFGLLDDPVGQEDGLTTGLMTSEGERKPAYRAYAAE